jgi:hypothetical protein
MSTEFIRKEYRREKSSSVVELNHKEMVCRKLFDIKAFSKMKL